MPRAEELGDRLIRKVRLPVDVRRPVQVEYLNHHHVAVAQPGNETELANIRQFDNACSTLGNAQLWLMVAGKGEFRPVRPQLNPLTSLGQLALTPP